MTRTRTRQKPRRRRARLPRRPLPSLQPPPPLRKPCKTPRRRQVWQLSHFFIVYFSNQGPPTQLIRVGKQFSIENLQTYLLDILTNSSKILKKCKFSWVQFAMKCPVKSTKKQQHLTFCFNKKISKRKKITP